MQVIVVVIGVKFLTITTVTTAYSVKMNSFGALHGALPWPIMLVC